MVYVFLSDCMKRSVQIYGVKMTRKHEMKDVVKRSRNSDSPEVVPTFGGSGSVLPGVHLAALASWT